MKRFQTRVLVPVVTVSVCLVVLCAVVAGSLFTQQEAVTRVLRENVDSRRAAAELRGTLNVLVELEHRHVENVADLNDTAGRSIRNIRKYADQPEERRLADRLEAGFAEYLRRWQTVPADRGPRHEAAVTEAVRVLETEVLLSCREYEAYNDRRVDESTTGHERTLGQLAWGMAGVGGLGAVAGLVIGYGFARGLSQSIRRLRVQLADAAGKLDPDAAELVISGPADFNELQAEAERLTEKVGALVERLHQREREVRRAEQLAALGQLAAGVAHEIRNPLTSIKMLVQTGEPLTAEDLAVIESEVRRMEGSLQMFLDYARPPKVERRPTELVGVVRRAFDLLRPRAERQKVEMVVRAAGEVSLTADPNQLHQVMVNLGLNALDAMPTGGTLTATVTRQNRGVIVEVADTGPGIPPDILARLFEPFASGKDTGLGLGLVVCKRIAEDHGGNIRGGNGPTSGARFTITLPFDPVGDGHA